MQQLKPRYLERVYRRVGKAIALLLGLTLSISPAQSQTPQEDSTCPPPVLSRLQRHRIAAGETIASIASQYGLIPITLVRLNPSLSGGSAPVGREILIPPINGIRIQVPRGATWKDLGEAYGVRADILFELNGCQRYPSRVAFVPGVNWTSGGSNPRENYTGLSGYPLPNLASIGLAYGWRSDTAPEGRRFHSGLDLLAEPGTPVLAADAGVVAFVGQQGNYGKLVVVNHANGRQTRYAHLSEIVVRAGQRVRAGETIGAVGATGSPDLAASHLHFEVRYNSALGWVAQDPEIYLR